MKQEPCHFLTPSFRPKLPSPGSSAVSRTYGSLPEDLNNLDNNLHGVYGFSQAAHALSCSSLTNHSPEVPRQLVTSSSVQALTPASMIDDPECVSMDIDDDVYLSAENDLDWLGLSHVSNQTMDHKASNRLHLAKEIGVNFGGDAFDLNLASTNGYDHLGKSSDSLFECDSGHQLMMAVDMHDSGKWSF